MISIEFDGQSLDLHITIGGDNFRDLVDFLKDEGARWNGSAWCYSVTKYMDFYENCKKIGEDPQVDTLSERRIAQYFANLKELKLAPTRRTFHQELMTFPPLKGKGLNANFQLQDILRGMNQNRFLFNHQMGLGKSYILTALIAHLRYYGAIDKSLVFSTSIGVLNLKDEILKHTPTLKDEDIIAFTSASKMKFDDRDVFNTEKYPQKIIIMTYDVLKSVSNYYYDIQYGTKKKPHPSTGKKYRNNCMPIEQWIGDKPAGLFLDENHSLAVPTSRRTQIMQFIIPKFEYRYEFTGTLADRYEKLYMPCMILDRDLVEGKSYNDWLATYNDLGNRFSAYAVNPNGWHLDKIGDLNKRLLKTYGSKRLMNECLDLPMNYEHPTLYCDMSPKQRQIYQSFANYTMQSTLEYAKQHGQTLTDRAQNMFQYVQGSVDNPTCIAKSDKFSEFPPELQRLILSFDYNKDSTKVEMLDEVVSQKIDEEGQKGIIWYFHPETMESIAKRYAKYNPCIISADVPMNERVPTVKRFLADPKQKMLIASINVMNTSITCVECQWEFYLEKTYNYTIYAQSRGRIYRPGQTNITETFGVRYNDSIDNLQELNLKTKGETINSLMNKTYIEKDLWKKLFNLQKDSII